MAASRTNVLSEAQIQRQILDWLAAKHILAFRMNTGAHSFEHNGKSRFVRYGVPGMADILTFPKGEDWGWVPWPTWIECKAPDGKQTELQRSFQRQVEEDGHKYILARSLDDVRAIMASCHV